jgi:hypothetical protein
MGGTSSRSGKGHIPPENTPAVQVISATPADSFRATQAAHSNADIKNRYHTQGLVALRAIKEGEETP